MKEALQVVENVRIGESMMTRRCLDIMLRRHSWVVGKTNGTTGCQTEILANYDLYEGGIICKKTTIPKGNLGHKHQ